MTSTVTKSRSLQNTTRGHEPSVLEKVRAWRMRAVLGLSLGGRAGHQAPRADVVSTLSEQTRKEITHVCDMFPLRLPHQLRTVTTWHHADLAAMYQWRAR